VILISELAKLGGSPDPEISKHQVSGLSESDQTFQTLNVRIAALTGKTTLPACPGIANSLLPTGSTSGFGMISKREVRLSIPLIMQSTPEN
jgi:hypothetical protein